MTPDLAVHLAGGATTLARAWAVTRRDGLTLAFTDHDRALRFAGLDFLPDSGLTARALVAGNGLAVDNTEAMGALSSDAISAADLRAGRYDGAEVRHWIVNWAAPDQHDLRFRGSLGEVRQAEGAFHAELRGLTEALNRPQGRVYHRDCAAVLGDGDCRMALTAPEYRVTRPAEGVAGDQVFSFAHWDDHADGWFAKGRLEVLGGAAKGLEGIVKSDRLQPGGGREITLWAPVAAPILPGDLLRLTAGCDKRAQTCRLKFGNLVNFQGFPHLPGEDWLIAGPRANTRPGAPE